MSTAGFGAASRGHGQWTGTRGQQGTRISGGGTGTDITNFRSIEVPSSRLPLFAQHFVPWMSLAELIEDWNPELATATRGFGLVLRSSLESAAREHLLEFLQGFRDSGLTPATIDEVGQELVRESLPLRPEELSDALAVTVSDLKKTESIGIPDHPENWTSSMLVGLINIVSHLFVEAKPIHGVMWSTTRPHSDIPEPTRDRIDRRPPETAHYWRVTASLELPSRLDEKRVAVCYEPIHRIKGDKVVCTEQTYLSRREVGFRAEKLQREVPVTPDRHFYRDTIDTSIVDGYFDTVPRVPALLTKLSNLATRPLNPVEDGQVLPPFCFSLDLCEERGKYAGKLRRVMIDKRELFDQFVDSVVSSAAAALEGAGMLLMTQGFDMGPLLPLLEVSAASLLEGIYNFLLRRLGEAQFTPWTLRHQVLYKPPVEPLSIFSLLSPNAPQQRLHTVAQGSDGGSSRAVLSDHYPDSPGFYYASRFMVGPSKKPPQVPQGLWQEVNKLEQPAVWSDPVHDRAGFRALVPLTTAKGKGRYVIAVRSDVEPRDPRQDHMGMTV